MKDIQTVQIVLDKTTGSPCINSRSSDYQSAPSVHKRADINDFYDSSCLDSSSSSFIEEFAYGNKALAIGKLIHMAHNSKKTGYVVDEEKISDDLQSKGWNDFQEYILWDQQLDYDSIA